MKKRVATVIYTAFLVTAGIRVYKSLSNEWKRTLKRMCSGWLPMPKSFYDALLGIRQILESVIGARPQHLTLTVTAPLRRKPGQEPDTASPSRSATRRLSIS